MELIESGTISSPVEYLDIDLPSGYSVFRLVIVGLAITDYSLGGAFSFDGGLTFKCDPINLDNYNSRFAIFRGDVTLDNDNDDNSVMIFVPDDVVSLENCCIEITISPGSAGFYASAYCQGWIGKPSPSNGGRFFFSAHSMEDDAVLTPPLARATTIRLAPDGNLDIDPPTSGATIDTGSYFLYGVPTP